jgi:hypothetical protein
VLADPAAGVYKKLVIKGDKLVGAVMYGDTVDGTWYFRLLRDGANVSPIREKLMFGESNLGDTGHEGQSRAAGHGRRRRGLRLQRRLQGPDREGHQRTRGSSRWRRSQAHQGLELVRLVHRAWSSRS